MLRRKSIPILLVVVAAAFIVFLLNVGGWRARILARLLRTNNEPVVVPLPANFRPQVPPGFRVSILAGAFESPRWLAVAPNGDVFVADSAAGKVVALHLSHAAVVPTLREIFAEHLNLPFGIAFHGEYVYVANTNQILRFSYDPRTSKRLGDAEPILDLPVGGHWTRSLAFSADGKKCTSLSVRKRTCRSSPIHDARPF